MYKQKYHLTQNFFRGRLTLTCNIYTYSIFTEYFICTHQNICVGNISGWGINGELNAQKKLIFRVYTAK